MKRIKLFNDSFEFSHGRLTRDDLEDYFLEFIDAGDLVKNDDGSFIQVPDDDDDDDDDEYRYHGDTDYSIRTKFYFNRKYRGISDIDILNRYNKMLSKICNVITRWGLDFKFNDIGFQIKQPVPQVIIDKFLNRSSYIKFNFGNRKIQFLTEVNIGEDMFFYNKLQLLNTDGSGKGGRWIKKDYDFFKANEKDIITMLEKEISKESGVKCQFIKGGGQYMSTHSHIYHFKLFV
jgi:hypothetical protein